MPPNGADETFEAAGGAGLIETVDEVDVELVMFALEFNENV